MFWGVFAICCDSILNQSLKGQTQLKTRGQFPGTPLKQVGSISRNEGSVWRGIHSNSQVAAPHCLDHSKNSYLSSMNLKEAIQHSPQEFLRLCKSHDVKLLYAFGSSVNDRFKEDTSDIDLLVELSTEDPAQRGENLLNLWDQFEQFFQRKVDLLSTASIRNPILKKSIDASKVLVYDGTELKVSFLYYHGD